MNVSTFNKVTKKKKFRPLRVMCMDLTDRLKLFYLNTMVKLHIFNEHKDYSTNYIGQPTITRGGRIAEGRAVFETSYCKRQIVKKAEHWIETKKGKKIHVFSNSINTTLDIDWRAELDSFEVIINPIEKRTVQRNSKNAFSRVDFVIPVSQKIIPVANVQELTRPSIKVKRYSCDFFNVRYAYHSVFTDDVEPSEAFNRSWLMFKASLRCKDAEINERLIGVKNDGNLVSPEGYPLKTNVVCKCGRPVFAHTNDPHYLCIKHGHIPYSDTFSLVYDMKRYSELLETFMPHLLEYCNREI